MDERVRRLAEQLLDTGLDKLETSNYRANFARAAAHRHWWR